VPVSVWLLGVFKVTIQLPPIYRDCRRLLLHTEEVVRRFSRYHKYTVGTDLRQQAMVLMRGVHVAVYDKPNQARHVQALVWQVDSYKLTLQLAIELGAFVVNAGTNSKKTSPGFAAFETAAQLAGQIGKQCGGWQKSVANPQTASASRAQAVRRGAAPAHAGPKLVAQPPARPASLSEHTTPNGVEPAGVTP
jgi:hypothetical protein